jgi:hypothetical protein
MSAIPIEQFVRGDTQRALMVQIVNAAGVAVPITGWTLRYQASSADLPDLELDLAAEVVDALKGICQVPAFGDQLTAEQLGAKTIARYLGRVRGTDPYGRVGWTELIEADILAQPIPEI